MTISGYFIGYARKIKSYKFYCPSHSIRFVELRNVEFPENDLASVNDQFQNIISEREQPSPTSEGLVIIQNTHQVQTSVAQPIIEDPQPIIDNPTYQVVHKVPEWLNN